jgi:hypothetical protein
MTRMHFLFVTAIAASCCLLHTPAAAAEGFDGKWSGTFSCAKLSFTKGPLKVAMDVTVANGVATYARDVLNADGSRIVGTAEGTGTIGADGKVTLSETWKSADERPRYTYTASYEGSFKGNAANLKGTQVWSFDRKTENRACTIALKQ